MAGARKTFFDPANVVLATKGLILLAPPRISLRFAAPRKNVAALLPATTGVRGGLFGRRAVVDQPDFIEARGAHGDLIKLGIVGNRIHVQQVGADVTLLCAGRDVPE